MRPIAVLPVMIVVGLVPLIMRVISMRVGPFVVMERELYTWKMNSRVRVPAIAIPVTGGIRGCGKAGAEENSTHHG